MLKATILSRVNKICKRAETDIDDILYDALIKISRRTLSLKGLETGNTVANQNYIDIPTDMCGRSIDGLVIDGSVVRPISWQQFLTGNTNGYCYYSDKIYLNPVYTIAKTYTLYYSKIHTSDLSTILFPDAYQMAVIRLTASLLYDKYEIYDGVQTQLGLYEIEMNSLMRYNDSPPIVDSYGDTI